MSAPTQTRVHHTARALTRPPLTRATAAGTGIAARPRTPGRGADTRLRWWTLLLPAIAFAALLLLLSGSGDAHAATTGEGSALAQLVDGLLRALP
ncbi:hypothetical protein ACIQUQ_34920 [Streptomyces sp. NPDC101118]|uniref:hypothetical protein n=1 Tax=Streptomyces sp. NPDC101118 TaxID=3366109 RepID=UPI00380A96BF